jgi:hypothetical protein
MAKLNANYPSFLVGSSSKRNQLISKIHLICESDLVTLNVNLDPSTYGLGTDQNIFEKIDSDTWIEAHIKSDSGFNIKDPLRGTLLKFWNLSNKGSSSEFGDNSILKYSSLSFPSHSPNKEIPHMVQFGIASKTHDDEDSDYIHIENFEFGKSFNGSTDTVIQKPVNTNPYSSGYIENISWTTSAPLSFAGPGALLESSRLVVANLFSDQEALYAAAIEDRFDGPYGAALDSNSLVAGNKEDSVRTFANSALYVLQYPQAISENTSNSLLGNPIMGKPETISNEDGDLFHGYGAFRDSAFELSSFVSTQAIEVVDSLEDQGNFSGVLFADVDPVYSFLSTQYEADLYANEVSHTKLPNLYKEIRKLNKVGNDSFIKDVLKGSSQLQYFAEYYKNINQPSISDHSMRHIFVCPEGVYSNDTVNQYKTLFPMHVDISFRSHGQQQKLMPILKSSGAHMDLWRSIVSSFFYEEATGETKPFALKQPLYSPYGVTKSPGGETHRMAMNNLYAGVEKVELVAERNQNDLVPFAYQNPAANVEKRMYVFNFDKWFKDYPENNTNLAIMDSITSFDSAEFENSSNSKNPLVVLFESVAKSSNITSKVKQFANNHMRTYKQIMDGEKAYSEVLFYRIQKKLNGSTVQNIWLENTPGIDVLQYIDTQVKYGVDYDYRIHAYAAVVGTKYRYGSNFTTTTGKIIPKLDDKIGFGNQLKWLDINGDGIVTAINSNGYINEYNSSVTEDEDLANQKKVVSANLPGGDVSLLQGSAATSLTDLTLDSFNLLNHYASLYPSVFQPLVDEVLDKLQEVVKVYKDLQAVVDAANEAELAKEEASAEASEAAYQQDLEDFDALKSAAISNQEKIIKDLKESLSAYNTPENNTSINNEAIGYPAKDMFDKENYDNTIASLLGVAIEEFGENYMLSNWGSVYNMPSQAAGFVSGLVTVDDYDVNLTSSNAVDTFAAKLLKYAIKLGYQHNYIMNFFENNSPLSFLGSDIYDLPSDQQVVHYSYTLLKDQGKFVSDNALLQHAIERAEILSLIESILGILGPMSQAFKLIDAVAADDYDPTKAPIYTPENFDYLLGDEEFLEKTFDNIMGDKLVNLFTILHLETQDAFLQGYHKPQASGSGILKLETIMQTLSEPFIKIMQIPVYQEKIAVVDDPPLPPQPTFNIYHNVNNKLLITFDNQVGQRLEKPVVLGGDDQNAMDKVRRKQDADYTIGEITFQNTSTELAKKSITFKSDDYAKEYQIFKLPYAPTNFNNITSENLRGVVDASTSASFVDNISPNTKNYYFFRTIDKHGHPSNPSIIYEIEIVSDEGFSYLLVDSYRMGDELQKGDYTKSFNRYLQIDPAFLQSLIDEDKTNFKGKTSAYGVDPQLGILPESIYNHKKFKVRVTSRASGRKLDFNVEYKKKLDEVKMPQKPMIL